MNSRKFSDDLQGIINCGSFQLREIQYLANKFQTSRSSASRLCHALHLPLIHFGSGSFYNHTAWERILYVLTRYGGPGFAAPGSRYKAKCMGKQTTGPRPLKEVTDEILAQAESRAMLIEMQAASGKSPITSKALAQAQKRLEPHGPKSHNTESAS